MALKLAHFPAVKELAGFDFEAQPSIDPKEIRDLAASRWIANGENVLLPGPRASVRPTYRAPATGDSGRIHGTVHNGDDPSRWPRQGAWRAATGRETAGAVEAEAADRR